MHSPRFSEYISPFSARYASAEMSHLFSEQFKISTFRKLWTSLAKAQRKLGLPISHQQIAELEDHIDKIDFGVAHAYEKHFRHDVIAHIHALSDQCPKAKSIIHLGATSTYVTDNTDLIQLKNAMKLLFSKLIHILRSITSFAKAQATTPCLGYTHFQPAQPTTIGKRACLWLQDLFLDAKEFERNIDSLPFLGVKGATGTQASFLHLFDQDETKVEKLESFIAKDFGFTEILPICGQTYTRKIDLMILNILESLAASTHKIATDIRLLAHEGEISEKKSETQVGSSAMPFKRNPIYSERICGIARFVISIAQNPAYTTATQWLERSLDDSSNRRLCIPEAFLGTDAILNLLTHLFSNLQVDQNRAKQNLEIHLPHLIMETVLMEAVKKGEDRQKMHETLRQLSDQSIDTLAKKMGIDLTKMNSNALTGRATSQTRSFIKQTIEPYLQKHKNESTSIPFIEI